MSEPWNLEEFKQALDRCECEHKNCHHSPIDKPNNSAFHIRLIDIERRCIVKADQAARYVILSYVWGQTRQLMLTQSTLEEFATEGSLKSRQHELSRTIRDAIALCERFGERYLWIDTLCLIQDSMRDKMWQIGRMGRIYRGATLTVVAAAGSDADAGLPALNANCWAVQQGEKAQYPDADERFERAMAGCKWDTRGWTFQEKVLSSRMLIFTESEVYFRCQTSSEGPTQRPAHGFLGGIRLWLTGEDSKSLNTSSDADLAKYTQLVEEYSSRQLTYQADALKAFTGIQDIFSKIHEKSNTFTFGLPAAAFDYAFCWSVEEHRPDLRRPEFPSWSWVGWRQKVSYKHLKNDYSYTSNLIKIDNEKANMPFESFSAEITSPRSWSNYAHSPNIVFETSSAYLRVSRSGVPHVGSSTSAHYEVASSYDPSAIYGTINLDTSWRDHEDDGLQFIVIRTVEKKEVILITQLLCLEHEGEKMFRVNMMQGIIPWKQWKVSRPKAATISLF